PGPTLIPYTTLFRSAAEEELQVGGPVPDGGECDLSLAPQQHHPAGDADSIAGCSAGREVRVSLPDGLERDVRFEPQREWFDAARSEEHTSELQSPYE